MRTGKLSISRGYQFGEDAAPVPRLVLVPRSADAPPPKPARVPAAPPAPVSEEYRIAHDRLTALERLARLVKQGALSAEEFAAEKARILGQPSDELVLRDRAPTEPIAAGRPVPQPGPSLLGRVLNWKFLPVGLAAGLGLSFASQPQETMRFFDEALRLLGA